MTRGVHNIESQYLVLTYFQASFPFLIKNENSYNLLSSYKLQTQCQALYIYPLILITIQQGRGIIPFYRRRNREDRKPQFAQLLSGEAEVHTNIKKITFALMQAHNYLSKQFIYKVKYYRVSSARAVPSSALPLPDAQKATTFNYFNYSGT